MEEIEDFKWIVSELLDMGNSMLPVAIDIHIKEGQFLCRACGLLFQGHMLVYDPMHNAAEWV